MSTPETPQEPERQRYRMNRGGQFSRKYTPEQRAATRALYEAHPGTTIAEVSKETGIPVGTLLRWKMEEQWQPAQKTMPDLAGRAGQLANTFKVRMSELGKPLSDEVAAQEVAREISQQEAVNVRAAVLDRHRKEWSAPRKIIYEAIQMSAKGDVVGGFEKAKLAKISAETLQIVQIGECRAFGLNEAARSADGGTVITIEREEPAALPPAGPAPGQVDDGEEF